MQNIYDYRRFAVLYVDDEEKSLKYFDRAFGEVFRVVTANNAAEGYRILDGKPDDFAIIISDQRMPGEQGVQFLEKTRALRSRYVRILATAYADLDAAIGAVNSGAVYKYITKPWDVPDLEILLKRAMEFFLVQRERDTLLKEKLAVLHHVTVADRVLSLGVAGTALKTHLRNPLRAVRRFVDLIPEGILAQTLDLEAMRRPGFWPDYEANMRGRITELLSCLGIGSHPRPTEWVPVDLADRIRQAFPQLEFSGTSTVVQGDPILLDCLFGCVAACFAGAGAGARVVLSSNAEGKVRIQVGDPTHPFSVEPLLAMFDPSVVPPPVGNDMAMQLLAAFLATHHHDGEISVNSSPAAGAEVIVDLPSRPGSATPEEGDDLGEFLTRVLVHERLWDRIIPSH